MTAYCWQLATLLDAGILVHKNYLLPIRSINLSAGHPESNSSSSSETSISSQQNNGWSFEEQFKQVRQVSKIRPFFQMH